MDNHHSSPTKVEKMRGLPWSVAFSATTTVFGQLSFFGSMWVVFLSYLGLNKTSIGFLLSFIYFTDVVALFIAPAVARFGYKRTFILSWAGRYGFVLLLFALPWVIPSFGMQGVMILSSFVMITFCLCRSIGMTALNPWQHEYIPTEIRGKYVAVDNLFTNIGNILSVLGIGLVLGTSPTLEKFLWLIAIGIGFGILSVWTIGHVPGGAPRKKLEVSHYLPFRDRFSPLLKDRRLLFYLLGASLILLTNGAIISFVPLYMQEKVGLPSGMVILIQTGTMAGGMIASIMWGWAADRFGSKPVVLSGMLLTAILPVFLLAIPRHSPLSAGIGLTVVLFQGIANMGWTIGSNRLLFVNVVPDAERSEYMAINNTWTGIVSGISQLAGGTLLDLAKNLSGNFLFLTIDAYTVLFAAGILLPFIGSLIISKIRDESAISPREMAAIFMRGNPILAVDSLVRYQFARDEESTVLMTERFGHARSLLTVEELLEALADPRFNVRFEAVVAIAHLGRQEPRLREALIQALQGSQPALSVAAAWAIGRLGDPLAIPALRESLNSRYRSVQDHAARALATLGDSASIPVLLGRLERETDFGLRLSFLSSLGKLQTVEALPIFFQMLAEEGDENIRLELALGIARIIGEEHDFIQILRRIKREAGTAVASFLSGLHRKWEKERQAEFIPLEPIKSCSEDWASGNIDQGYRGFRTILSELLELEMEKETRSQHGEGRQLNGGDPISLEILRNCERNLARVPSGRIEYVLLALICLKKY